jgi:hypothetical protein
MKYEVVKVQIDLLMFIDFLILFNIKSLFPKLVPRTFQYFCTKRIAPKPKKYKLLELILL